MKMNPKPPPIIDSAKLISFASNDEDVEYTDRINLHVGTTENDFVRIGEMPNLAITRTYYDNSYLLMLCDEGWNAEGVLHFTTIEEAKAKAELGYKGISNKWKDSPYGQQEIDDFLRDVYEVDPRSEWWTMICSFCGKKDSEFEQLLQGKYASICRSCVKDFYEEFFSDT
jgi:hypothetical protein